MRIALALLACLLTLLAFQALAKPAPWYLWESRIDGQRICLQYPPGDGWRQIGGPFSDIRCSRPQR